MIHKHIFLNFKCLLFILWQFNTCGHCIVIISTPMRPSCCSRIPPSLPLPTSCPLQRIFFILLLSMRKLELTQPNYGHHWWNITVKVWLEVYLAPRSILFPTLLMRLTKFSRTLRKTRRELARPAFETYPAGAGARVGLQASRGSGTHQGGGRA